MAEIVDETSRGTENIYKVVTSSTFKRRAVAKARREVHPLIPLRDQEIINVSKDRDLGFRTRYIVTVAHNKDEYGMKGY